MESSGRFSDRTENRVATKTKALDGIDPQAIKALGHPARLDALRLFNERSQASPNEIAGAMDVDVSYIAHHIRVLRECGCIELVDTVQRRGATEHYYRATKRANVTKEIAKALPKSMREGITAEMITAIFERIGEAIERETFDARDDRHVSWMSLTLDEQGWNAFVELKAKQLKEEMEIEAESVDRLAGSGAPGVKATTVSMLFEMPAERV
jgi:DNA-binding transcriptional ArsR family regulator